MNQNIDYLRLCNNISQSYICEFLKFGIYIFVNYFLHQEKTLKLWKKEIVLF